MLQNSWIWFIQNEANQEPNDKYYDSVFLTAERQSIEILLNRRGSIRGGAFRELVVNKNKFSQGEDEKVLDMIVMGVYRDIN